MEQKHVLFNFIAGIVLIIFVTSCSKDPAMPDSGSNEQGQQQKIVNFVAGGWAKQSSTWVYVDVILGIMQNWNQATIYVESSNGELLLTATPTLFLTGEIWVTVGPTDIILNYRDFNGPSLPFRSLDMKIVFTN